MRIMSTKIECSTQHYGQDSNSLEKIDRHGSDDPGSISTGVRFDRMTVRA